MIHPSSKIEYQKVILVPLRVFLLCVFFLYFCIYYVCVCVCTWVYIHVVQHVEAHEGQKNCKVLLELELQIALGQHGRAENHTWLLCKSSKHSICWAISPVLCVHSKSCKKESESIYPPSWWLLSLWSPWIFLQDSKQRLGNSPLTRVRL